MKYDIIRCMDNTVNVLCLKWGTLYPAEYVNRLYAGVKKHLKRKFRFVCVTDDAEGLVPGVETYPLPPAPDTWRPNSRYTSWPGIYIKLMVFKPGFADLEGPVLFLDIDQIITGDLDRFFDFEPGRFCIIHNWIEWHKCLFRRRPDIGNSSCFRFNAGASSAYIYEKWISEIEHAQDQRFFRTEQAYMTHAVGLGNISWWPENFVRSFKRSCQRVWPLNHILRPKFNPDTSILCFHGHPSPDEAITGFKGRHLNTWTRPAPWVKELWLSPLLGV